MIDPSPYIGFSVEMADPKPVSINKLYVTGRGGRRFLSSEGKHFKDRLQEEVSKAVALLDWKSAVDGIYKNGAGVSLVVILALDHLRNPAWKVGGGTTASGALRSPYNKNDVSNYIKLIEDAVAKGTGIDDSAHVEVTMKKVEDKENPRIIIRYGVHE